MKILLNRFIKNSNFDIRYDFQWKEGEYLTIIDIDNAIKNNIHETIEPFGHPKDGERYKDIDYHIRRIIYFINHPDEIRDIEIGYHYHGMKGAYSYCTLVDGFHRLAAAVYLKYNEIDIIYEGRQDVFDYLTGKRIRQPNKSSMSWDIISIK